ncbi:MAG: ABC transporter permease [Saprospiraceae bacterium]|nr:ABC transporter permease [Saprospiraceae bacterium]
MFINHFRIAIRSLQRQKGYSLLNVVGLSVALAATILILLWVQDEWVTDKFHVQGDRLQRLYRTIPIEGGEVEVTEGIPYPLLVAVQEELPEVDKYIPYREGSDESLIYNNTPYRVKGTFATASFFEAFSFPVLQGDPMQLDRNAKAMAISRRLAQRIFGNTWQVSAMGETIHIHDEGDFTVELIYEDFPENATLQHEMLYSFQHFRENNEWINRWTNSGMQGVLLLAPDANAADVAAKIERLYQENQEDADLVEGCVLHSYADHYLFGQFDERGNVEGGRIEYVRTFAVAAFLLLVISCINFVNLATALAARRAKEVGIRKVVGARRRSLVGQFLVEALVVTMAAMILALFMAVLLQPLVFQLTGKQLAIPFSSPVFWLALGGIGLVTMLLSGAYPAFVLSGFRPEKVLKSKITSWRSNISMRKVLVVMQFILALLLIAGAFVVRKQVQFIMNTNLGVAKENILRIPRDENIASNYEALRTELTRSPAISDVTSTGPSPLSMGASTSGVDWPGKRPDQANQEFHILWSEQNFPDLFEVPLAAGEFYRSDVDLDSTQIVLNEKAVEVMGIDDPIGKSITWWGLERKIIGVVKDFHNQSLYSSIAPTGILQDRNGTYALFVKSEQGQLKEAIAHLQRTFKEIVPEVPLHYDFLDEQYAEQYDAEVLTGKLANYFAVIAIFISIMGLLGLATYVAQQRRKELGVRKVLGASDISLVSLLSKDFLILVLLASFAGVPVARYLLGNWLNKFEYKIELSWELFLVPVVVGLVLTTVTVGLQSLRVAHQNPVNAIKEE